ncbi:hypothetical protein TI04_12995 [Achromatium sp. WMS2]|nr:hypothetical protein TI04_12995 [Achromatium sp. WMS2]
MIPKALDRIATVDRKAMRQSLIKNSILTNEKNRAVKLNFKPGLIQMRSSNVDNEEAYDELEIDYDNNEFETAFNVTYLLDIFGAMASEKVQIEFSDIRGNSIAIKNPEDPNVIYVVMPINF